MTVIDEVHRIGSEEFSKTLLRVITPVMLGISATVERKDKLERLLYMFIGERVYSDTTRSEDEVCVRAIDYVHIDPALAIPLLDARGNPAFSAMMSRLCTSTHRNDFVIQVLTDLVRESPTAQIMVLAHQRAMLTYIHDKIVANNIATTGFYIGGTKPAILKATEEKQIVLATFSMAAEALDIKTLSTLFMITPKSDIVQSVGRILRAKHSQPIIVDLVDAPVVFKNQFRKRMEFYKGNNYRVRRISGNAYSGFEDMRGWRTMHSPVAVSQELKCAPDDDGESNGSSNDRCEIRL
jgi:superfamily II DNA or RNA helicase